MRERPGAGSVTRGGRATTSRGPAAVATVLGLGLLASACGGDTGAAEERPSPESAADAPGRTGAAASEEARADSLVDAWIRAAGGLEAWRSVATGRYTVTTVWIDSTGAVERMRPRRVEFRRTASGNQARIERPEAEGLYVQVFDGDTAWATLNGRPLPPDHPAVEETEYVARDVVYWIGLPYKLRDPGVNRRAERLPDGGWEVRVTFGEEVGVHPGDRYFYYFLDEDPWPEEVHYIEQGRTEEDRNRTRWIGFREAGPLTYVVTRRWVDAAGRPTKELRIDDVWIGPELPDSLFRPPAAGDAP